METRFVKAKVDKYIQWYSKFGKNENITYDWVLEIEIQKDLLMRQAQILYPYCEKWVMDLAMEA